MEKSYVVGTREVLRLISKGKAKRVYVAKDADSKVVNPVIEECMRMGIEIEWVSSKKELGRMFGISRPAAAAAIKNGGVKSFRKEGKLCQP